VFRISYKMRSHTQSSSSCTALLLAIATVEFITFTTAIESCQDYPVETSSNLGELYGDVVSVSDFSSTNDTSNTFTFTWSVNSTTQAQYPFSVILSEDAFTNQTQLYYKIQVDPQGMVSLTRPMPSTNKTFTKRGNSTSLPSAGGSSQYWTQYNPTTGAIWFGDGQVVGNNIILDFKDFTPLNISKIQVNQYCPAANLSECTSAFAGSAFTFCTVDDVPAGGIDRCDYLATSRPFVDLFPVCKYC